MSRLSHRSSPYLVMFFRMWNMERLGWLLCFFLATSAASIQAGGFDAWQFRQDIQIKSPGLTRINLPLDSLNAMCADLADLRLAGPDGKEVPCLFERPRSMPKTMRPAKSFQVLLGASFTTVEIETGFSQPVEAVDFTTPSENFIKAIRLEGSTDHETWQPIVKGQPIFRQPNGAGQLRVQFPPGQWRFLRAVLDDTRSRPIPITGILLTAAAEAPLPSETLPVRIVDCSESLGQTRLTLDLGSSHLDLSELEIETAEPLFMRRVTVVMSGLQENDVRERVLAQGTVYRVAVEGQAASSCLTVPLEFRAPSLELMLLVQNYDNPPLQISEVRVKHRHTSLVFMARAAGTHTIYSGSRKASAPHYDLMNLNIDSKNVPLTAIEIGAVSLNPEYRPAEVLAEISPMGAALDVSAWHYRKGVQLTRNGVQQLELDLQVMSRARSDFSDVRLISGGQQIPFLLYHPSLTRAVSPQVSEAENPKEPRISRWVLKLPNQGVPYKDLTCTTRAPLFERSVTVYEELKDSRGDVYRAALGHNSWVQTPGHRMKYFSVLLSAQPRTDTVFLEMDNGDNPPIALENIQLSYPVTRVIFKASTDKPVFLYYGNPNAVAPRYDLNLVAGQIFTAQKSIATVGSEETLKAERSQSMLSGAKAGIVFWSALGIVVVALLLVISRLLPKEAGK